MRINVNRCRITYTYQHPHLSSRPSASSFSPPDVGRPHSSGQVLRHNLRYALTLWVLSEHGGSPLGAGSRNEHVQGTAAACQDLSAHD
eukprot:scaffold2830_cov123-Isochrysis_galbana.AAC.1